MRAAAILATALSAADPRVMLLDASRGYVHPAFSYARSQTVFTRQADGSLASFAANVPPIAAAASLGPYYRLSPGYTQLCLRTTTLTNAAWTATGLNALTQSVASPTGANDAWVFTETTGNSAHKLEQTIAFTSGTTYTILLIAAARAGSRQATVVLPAAAFGSDAIGTLNPADGTSVKNGTALTILAEALNNGYYLFSISATATATASGAIAIAIHRSAAATVDSYTGDGTSGLNVLGVNVTDTAYQAPFIASNASSQTTSGSTWSATLAQLGLLLPGEYTMGAEYFAAPHAGTPPARVAFQVDGGSGAERSILRYNGAASAVRSVSVTGNSSSTVDSYVIAEGLRIRQAMRVQAAASRSAANGSLGAGLAVASPVGMTNVRLGNDSSGNQLTGGIIRAWLAPRALNDAALVELTRG